MSQTTFESHVALPIDANMARDACLCLSKLAGKPSTPLIDGLSRSAMAVAPATLSLPSLPETTQVFGSLTDVADDHHDLRSRELGGARRAGGGPTVAVRAALPRRQGHHSIPQVPSLPPPSYLPPILFRHYARRGPLYYL